MTTPSPAKSQNAKIARRVGDIEPFRVVEVLTRARELEAQGRDIVHMEAGEPDFETAAPIVEAGIAALRGGATQYSDANGLRPLREAIARYYADDYGLSIDPARIMVTPGASGALLLIAALLIDRGDQVLLADPGYPCNRHFMRLVEGNGVLVPVTEADNFQLTPELIAQHWVEADGSDGESSVAALVASPANPTGAVISKPGLAALYEAVAQRGGNLIVDEIYHGLDFRSPGQSRSAHSVLEITDDAFVINSFSKYFGMTGWRLGWLVAPPWACEGLAKLAQNLFISMSTMAQHAALACFEPATRQILDQRREAFAARCNQLLPALEALGFDVPQAPAGGLYIYAGISDLLAAHGESLQLGNNSQTFSLAMLEQHGIAITPGGDFGRYRADQHVRFAFTTGADRIDLAIERMQALFR